MTWPNIEPYLPSGLTPREFYQGAVISFCALVGVSLLFAVWNVWAVTPRAQPRRRGRRFLTLVFHFLAFRGWNPRKPDEVRIMMCAAEVPLSAVSLEYP
jgi:hypothetical protein